MPLPNSGTIGVSSLRTEFAAPISPAPVSQFYRGGAYVPAEEPGTTTPPSPACTDCGPYYNGSVSKSPSANYSSNCPEYDKTVFTCNAGPISHRFTGGPGPCNITGQYVPKCNSDAAGIEGEIWLTANYPGKTPYTCKIRQCNKAAGPGGSNPPTPINTGIPGGGTIGLSNFYGGRNV